MAEFNPPDSHWAGDFDQRLLGTFRHLLERIDRLEAEVRNLHDRDRHRDEGLAQAVADMRHHAQQQKGKP